MLQDGSSDDSCSVEDAGDGASGDSSASADSGSGGGGSSADSRSGSGESKGDGKSGSGSSGSAAAASDAKSPKPKPAALQSLLGVAADATPAEVQEAAFRLGMSFSATIAGDAEEEKARAAGIIYD